MQAVSAREGGLRVALATPTYTKPHPAYMAAVEAAVPALEAAGIHAEIVFETQNPYISAARATMLRKALDAKCDVIVFIDHDVAFRPDDLVNLILTEGDVVAGTYRFKKDDEEYMGVLRTHGDGYPIVRDDGCVSAEWVPAGFLKVTTGCIDRFMRAYPELQYGSPRAPSIDLFNHGAIDFTWYGEDVAFSKRWRACGGEIWIVPDLDLTHHSADQAYRGNYHTFLRKQPGGDLDPANDQPS